MIHPILKLGPCFRGFSSLQSYEGIHVDKLDKGCLIFNTYREDGCRVCIVDKSNKSGEAQYWKDNFLQIKSHENFDKTEFEEEIFNEPDVIESFRNFDSEYREGNDIEIADSFDISNQAVKKQARIFKSVLKLDKNFHIYIHGNRNLIEKGVDENGKKYYKIYYDEEK